MQVDAGVAAPDAALLIFACAKESKQRNTPQCLARCAGLRRQQGMEKQGKNKREITE
jgi:hypothetical protein